jgi:hypothetical protein
MDEYRLGFFQYEKTFEYSLVIFHSDDYHDIVKFRSAGWHWLYFNVALF